MFQYSDFLGHIFLSLCRSQLCIDDVDNGVFYGRSMLVAPTAINEEGSLFALRVPVCKTYH